MYEDRTIKTIGEVGYRNYITTTEGSLLIEYYLKGDYFHYNGTWCKGHSYIEIDSVSGSTFSVLNEVLESITLTAKISGYTYDNYTSKTAKGSKEYTYTNTFQKPSSGWEDFTLYFGDPNTEYSVNGVLGYGWSYNDTKWSKGYINYAVTITFNIKEEYVSTADHFTSTFSINDYELSWKPLYDEYQKIDDICRFEFVNSSSQGLTNEYIAIELNANDGNNSVQVVSYSQAVDKNNARLKRNQYLSLEDFYSIVDTDYEYVTSSDKYDYNLYRNNVTNRPFEQWRSGMDDFYTENAIFYADASSAYHAGVSPLMTDCMTKELPIYVKSWVTWVDNTTGEDIRSEYSFISDPYIITFSLPEYEPEISDASLTFDNTDAPILDTWNFLAQNISKAVWSANAASKFSATITEYALYASDSNDVTYLIDSSSTGVSKTSDYLNRSGYFDFYVVVKDTREITARYDLATKHIYAYSTPKIEIATAFRSDSQGAKEPEGEFVKLTFSSVLENNLDGNDVKTNTYRIREKGSTWSSAVTITDNVPIILSDISILKTYEIKYRVEDTLGFYSERTIVIPMSGVLINFRHGGTGLGIGMKTTRDYVLQCAWDTELDSLTVINDAEVDGDLEVGGSLTVNGQPITPATPVLPIDIVNVIYPVNSIFLSPTLNPNNVFTGTTWEKFTPYDTFGSNAWVNLTCWKRTA